MPASLSVRVFALDALAFETTLDAPLELGRQRATDPPPYALLPATPDAPARLVIAPQHDKDNVSRQHLTLTPLSAGRVRVTNHSQAALATDGSPIAACGQTDLPTPFTLALPGRTVRVDAADSGDEHGVHSLDQRTGGPASAELSFASHSLAGLHPEQLLALLDGVPRALGVLQSAVGSADFLDRAACALVQIVGLDTGCVLLRRDSAWEAAATHGPAADRPPSRHVLERLLATRSAVWQTPGHSADVGSASLRLLDVAVAAPLLDKHENVIGALYGERRKDGPASARADRRVAVLLVDLLACGVSTGLARLEQEKAALEATALFGQFFTPELVRHLSRDPAMLDGRTADVTVLFADVRAFSKHSERLGAEVAIRWMNDVLQELSRCVRDEGGVLVDYVGDELMAMWGAPEPQPDQATRAVRAGLAMHAALPELNRRWQETLGEGIAIGVGVNSGPAYVGNVGSKIKFKYGPLGNTVNVASRAQGLTKYLRCGLLATDATRRQLGDDFASRRVVRARVVNIKQPVDLYEIERAGDELRRAFFAESQATLDALEAGHFADAARAAGALLAAHAGDGAMLLALARATDTLVRGGEGFEAVWTPPGK